MKRSVYLFSCLFAFSSSVALAQTSATRSSGFGVGTISGGTTRAQPAGNAKGSNPEKFGNAKGSNAQKFGNAKGSNADKAGYPTGSNPEKFGNAKGSGGAFGGAKGSNPAPRFVLSGLARIGKDVLVFQVRNVGDGDARQETPVTGQFLKGDKILQQGRVLAPPLKVGEQATVVVTVPGAGFDRSGFLARITFAGLKLASTTERLPEEAVKASPFGGRR